MNPKPNPVTVPCVPFPRLSVSEARGRCEALKIMLTRDLQAAKDAGVTIVLNNYHGRKTVLDISRLEFYHKDLV